MLESKTVMIRWNGSTRKWYEEKGYKWTKANDYFECDIQDVQITSTVKVEAKCDYCGEIYHPEYRHLLKARELVNKDCCANYNCKVQKTSDVNFVKYGVKHHMMLETSQQNLRKIYQTPFQEVEKRFQDKNLILLSKESDYLNDRSRLFFICSNHKEFGEQETNYANIKKNKGCCNYGRWELCAESNRLDGNIVYQAFIDKGVMPQFKPSDYLNNQQQLPFICPIHIKKGLQTTSYVTLMSSPHKCYYCGKESTAEQLRLEESFVFEYFKNRRLVIIEGQKYKNKDTHIYFRCLDHLDKIQKITYNGLKNTKQSCDYCRAEESLVKLNKRLRNSLNVWKKQSKLNCQNKCIFTGSKKYDIHHLKSYNEIIKEALTELNYDIKDKYTGEEFINIKNKVIELHNKYPLGVCISNRIHVIFHQLYSKEASIEDFYEFKNRYELGEFDKLLEEVG